MFKISLKALPARRRESEREGPSLEACGAGGAAPGVAEALYRGAAARGLAMHDEVLCRLSYYYYE